MATKLKSCLKNGSRPSTPTAPYMGCINLPGVDSPKVDAKRLRTNSTPSNPSVKQVEAVNPSSQPTQLVDLHRSMVLPDRSNRLSRPFAIFDVTQPPSSIRLCDSTAYPSRISDFHRGKLASKQPHDTVMIECDDFAPKWKIKVKRTGGVTCGDVFDAIFEYLRQPISQADLDDLSDSRRAACQMAFERRCREKPVGLSAVELRGGLRRVDYLAGKTLFWGIYLTPDGTGKTNSAHWTLKLAQAPSKL